jgi:transcriptional regulator with XRE-family HTH domain|nr:helix-turn-helix transcriptional regulator [uncultured Acetatifactor sp.]
MRNDYKEVLGRLKEERERMSLSQREMCQHVGMSQGQYCKIENGEQYFSFHEVKKLSESGVDIHYIFTGQRVHSRYIKDIEAYDFREIICLLEVIYSAVTYYCVLTPSGFWRNLYREVQFIRLLDANQNFENDFFVLLRRLNGLTQREMALQFGMDTKKLRMLEKGQCQPDSELLWQFYRDFRVPPSIVIKDRQGLLNQAGCFLERIDSESKNNIIAMVKAFHMKN